MYVALTRLARLPKTGSTFLGYDYSTVQGIDLASSLTTCTIFPLHETVLASYMPLRPVTRSKWWTGMSSEIHWTQRCSNLQSGHSRKDSSLGLASSRSEVALSGRLPWYKRSCGRPAVHISDSKMRSRPAEECVFFVAVLCIALTIIITSTRISWSWVSLGHSNSYQRCDG